jgi:cell shape-determining protein MreC
MINKIKNALEARLTELEAKEETIDTLTRRLEVIKTLLTISKIEQDYDI